MRQFLLFAHDAPTDPDFSLDDLPGAGRMDLLARCVTSAFLLSHDIRCDVRMLVAIGDALTIRLEGSQLKGVHPDERSTAALLREAIAAGSDAVGHQPVESTPGVFVSRQGRNGAIATVADEGPLLWLHHGGTPVVDLSPPSDPIFVLSDHRSFTAGERDLLTAAATDRVRLGPRQLHADQAITVAHNYLDTRGYVQY